MVAAQLPSFDGLLFERFGILGQIVAGYGVLEEAEMDTQAQLYAQSKQEDSEVKDLIGHSLEYSDAN